MLRRQMSAERLVEGGLTDREQYVLSLVFSNGGWIGRDLLTNVVVVMRGPFLNLTEKYLRYRALPSEVDSLLDVGLIRNSYDGFELTPAARILLSTAIPPGIHEAISSLAQYRREHMLEFDLEWLDRYLFSYKLDEVIPSEVVEQLKEAVRLCQSHTAFDAVLTKCGKCMEILAGQLNKRHKLVREHMDTGKLLVRFMDKEVMNRFSEKVEDREAFRLFAYSGYVIYTYRSKLGAHTDDRLWWGKDQVALSALVLTFYLVDLFSTSLPI